MLIALTGTPGVGKTTVARLLGERGLIIKDQNILFSQMGLLDDYDELADSYLIALKVIEDLDLRDEEIVVLEGHLTHNIGVDIIIVLRCHPSMIFHRLVERGYPESKAKENALSEALDVILVESLEKDVLTFELDCTGLSPANSASFIMEIINGKCDGYLPGNVDWTEELIRWS